MLTAPELKSLLKGHGLRLTKRLGQHHLIEARAIGRIIDACRLSPGEAVVEIGAGLGALTEPLARRAGAVIAVEVDRRMAVLLAQRMRSLRNVTVRHQDILEFDWGAVRDVVVVGTIPYHITSPILASLTEHRHVIRRALLVMQEEVAQRLTAAPATKAYGRLSVLAQYGWRLTDHGRVPRSAFFPQPSVDSSCLALQPHLCPPVDVDDEARFFRVVKAAFAQRRKTLINNLLAADTLEGDRAHVARVLVGLGRPGDVRGEALSLQEFATLANLVIREEQGRKGK